MESNVQKTSTKRYRSREEILRLLDKLERSEGVTVKEFCRMHDISEATYYNWRIRYRSKSTKEQKSAGFIEIIPSAASAAPVSAAIFAEVRGIRLYQRVSADYLKTLAL